MANWIIGTTLLASLGWTTLARADTPSARSPLLILPINGPEAPAAALEAELSRALAAQLGPGSVTTTSELDVLLSAEKTKDFLGCDDVSCLNEVLGALGTSWAIGITLVAGEPLSEVLLIARDLRDATRSFRIERRAPSLMPARIGGLAEDLAAALLTVTGWRPSESRTPETRGGSLRISTAPAGARLFLNHDDIGRAPIEMSGLAAGDYRLRIGARGFKTKDRSLELGSGVSEHLHITLSPLRNWQAGAYFGIALHDVDFGNDVGGILEITSGGINYERELWRFIQVGGILGYQQTKATEQEASRTLDRVTGVSIGVQASIAGYFGLGSLLSVGVATTPEGPDKEQAELALARLEDGSADFALLSGRIRTRLVYDSPRLLSTELGVELGMASVVHVEFGYRRLVARLDDPIQHDSFHRISPNAFYARFIMGYSAWFLGPDG